MPMTQLQVFFFYLKFTIKSHLTNMGHKVRELLNCIKAPFSLQIRMKIQLCNHIISVGLSLENELLKELFLQSTKGTQKLTKGKDEKNECNNKTKTNKKAGTYTMAHAYNLNIQELEARTSDFKFRASQFLLSLIYIRFISNN